MNYFVQKDQWWLVTLGELHGVTRNCISSVGINSRSGTRRQSGHYHLDSLCVLARSSAISPGPGYSYLSVALSQVWSSVTVASSLHCTAGWCISLTRTVTLSITSKYALCFVNSKDTSYLYNLMAKTSVWASVWASTFKVLLKILNNVPDTTLCKKDGLFQNCDTNHCNS